MVRGKTIQEHLQKMKKLRGSEQMYILGSKVAADLQTSNNIILNESNKKKICCENLQLESSFESNTVLEYRKWN